MPVRTAFAATPPKLRSAIANGSRLFSNADGRSSGARRWRDLLRGFLEQTGGQHQQLCRTAASLIIQRERMDAALARGELVDATELVRVANAINRIHASIGLESCQREKPDLTGRVIEQIRSGA